MWPKRNFQVFLSTFLEQPTGGDFEGKIFLVATCLDDLRGKTHAQSSGQKRKVATVALGNLSLHLWCGARNVLVGLWGVYDHMWGHVLVPQRFHHFIIWRRFNVIFTDRLSLPVLNCKANTLLFMFLSLLSYKLGFHLTHALLAPWNNLLFAFSFK